MKIDAVQWLASVASACEPLLEEVLGPTAETAPDLWSAMRYSVLGGGKRLRPAVCLAAAMACGAEDAIPRLVPAACSLELMHTYSLIHDDLPAMDDAPLRRGRPSCHRVFGEAMATLAGDALQALAFEVLARSAAGVDDANHLRAISVLAQAAGAQGMCGGQALDLRTGRLRPDLEGLLRVEAAKTGALLCCSAEIGGLLADARQDQLFALSQYGTALGQAFQISDDILDVVGSSALLGKVPGVDAANGRITVVSLLGLDGAHQLAEDAVARAHGALAGWDERADALRALVDFVVDRDA